MKLPIDYVKILTKLRDNNTKIGTESALDEIEAVKQKYAKIAEAKKISAHRRVTEEYDYAMKKIDGLTDFTKTLVYLLSEEPGSDGWQLASDVIDSSISQEDD